ncbi:MAG: hypothetical protein Q8R28_19505, partial [Dehalococcoidia bacterium]|nr:hypothetical protein [Dehalococcoidia bacterium]
MANGSGPRGDAAKAKANAWERVLKWQFDLAARRSEPIREIAPHDAIMYDAICGQVIHLPTQIRAIEKLGGDPRRQKAARRFGDFVITVRNPKGIHIRWSDYMAEAVLQVKVIGGQEIKDFWGKKADKVDADAEYTLFDYCDFEERCVWATEGDEPSKTGADKDLVILKEEYDYNFLPWVCVRGSGRNEYRPLLYGAWKAEQWITSNLIGTLAVSQGVSEMGRPRVRISGPNPDSVQYEFGKPGGEYLVPPGHDVRDMEDRGLDPALREAFDRSVADMGRSTIPSILVTTEAQAGEPFSGYNLRIQQAIKSLLRQKRLTESWFGGAYRQMLEWAE